MKSFYRFLMIAALVLAGIGITACSGNHDYEALHEKVEQLQKGGKSVTDITKSTFTSEDYDAMISYVTEANKMISKATSDQSKISEVEKINGFMNDLEKKYPDYMTYAVLIGYAQQMGWLSDAQTKKVSEMAHELD